MRGHSFQFSLFVGALLFGATPGLSFAGPANCANLFSRSLPRPFDANLDQKIWHDLVVLYEEVQLEDSQAKAITLRRLIEQKLTELSQGDPTEKSRLLKKLASEFDEVTARNKMQDEDRIRQEHLGKQKKTTEWNKVPLNFKAAPIQEVGEPILTSLPPERVKFFSEARRDRWNYDEDDTDSSVDWSKDGRFLFLQAASGTKGLTQTYLYDLTTNQFEKSNSRNLLMSRADNVYVDRGALWNTVVDLQTEKVLYRFRGMVHPIREALGRDYVIFNRGEKKDSQVILRHSQTGEHLISRNYMIDSERKIVFFVKDEKLWQIDLVSGIESLPPGPWSQAVVEQSKTWNSSGLGMLPLLVDGQEFLLLARNLMLVPVPPGFDRIMFTTGDNVLFGKDVMSGPNGAIRNFYLINSLYHAEYSLDGVEYATLNGDRRFVHFTSKNANQPEVIFDLLNWKANPINIKYEFRYANTHFLRINPSTTLETHVLHPFTKVEMKWTPDQPLYPLDNSELWVHKATDGFEIFDPHSDYKHKVTVPDMTDKQVWLTPDKKFLMVETKRGILLYPIQWGEKPEPESP